MAFKFILDSLDGLDAAQHAFYKKGDDGKFRLEVDGLEDTAGLKSALQKERDNASSLSKQIKSWQGLGKTPEEISELLKAQEDLQRQKDDLAIQDALKKGEYQKVLEGETKKREQMAAKHQADLEASNRQAQGYKTALEQHLIDAQATAAIAEAKGVPQLLLPHVKGRVKVLEQDGKFSVQVLDAAGNPMVADAAGTPATFKHLIESFKADPVFGRAFEGNNASGGGGNGGGGKPNTGQKTMTRDAFNQLEPAAKMSFFTKDKGSLTD